MNQIIRRSIINSLSASKRKRPLNSRKLAKAMSKRFRTPIQRIYGNLSWLSKTGTVTWVSRKKGGPSYLKI